MRQRPHALEAVESLIDLALVVGTSIGTNASSVIARIRGDGPSSDEDDDQTFEEQDAEVWGEANLLSRPLDPNDDGSCEVVIVRRGDTREIIGMRDRRYQVTLEQGEVVLRNITADADKRATIKIDQNGTVTITAPKIVAASDDIQLTGADPADAMALASKCDDAIDAINGALDALANAAPIANDGGTALQTAFKVAWPGTPPAAPSDVGSTKVKGA